MSSSPKWYSSVARYQWLVLIVASLGWVFDAFEGQIFNITRKSMLAEILAQAPDSTAVKEWGDIVLGFFLVGGTLGGWLFGMLADRWGRSPTMIVTILCVPSMGTVLMGLKSPVDKPDMTKTYS